MRSPRVTLRQIAERAGVSHSTVSLCLHNSPMIPAETRERIKALAERMGWRPDPMLSALNVYRQHKKGPVFQATLAWINPFTDRKILRSNPDFNLYWEGAAEEANEAGYKVDEFWSGEPGMTVERLHRILKARQIQGVLVPPRPKAHDSVPLPWEFYSVVAFGYSHEPLFHLVANAQFRSARLAVQRMHAMGYRSIGMFSWPDWEERTDCNYSGGYVSECLRLGLKPQLCKVDDILTEDGGMNKNLLRRWKGQMETWLKKRRLDAMLMPDPTITSGLEEAGLSLREQMAVAVLSYYRRYPEFAGVDQNAREIGAAAVNQLVGMIHRNEKGLPESPLRILVESRWMDGPSVPER